MNKVNLLLIAAFLLISEMAIGQSVMTSEEAVQITLENNYGIRIAKNAVEIAANNTSKLNTGELPTVRFNSGAGYGISGSEINYHTENTPANSTWVTNGIDFNASLSANYLLYDFNSRKLNKQKLGETLNLSRLEERQAIENNLVATLISYYNIAQLEENLIAQEEVLQISRERRDRASLQFDYGKNNRLAVLNAEVDINRDSIDYLNLQQQLSNEKRNLNLLLGRPVDTAFGIDTSLTFRYDLSESQLLAEALAKNIDLLLLEKDMKISQMDISILEKALKPQISASSSLGIFGGANDNKSLVKNQFASDFAAGVSLSWNIFDGGYTRVRNDNLKIALGNIQLLQEQKRDQVIRDIKNAWSSYQNQLYILQVETRNIETARLNFLRTEDQFKIGQISSVEFRQAQLNKLYAQLNYNRAKFIAKINEINLMQLSGNVVDSF